MLKVRVEENARGLVFRHGRTRYAVRWPRGVWRKLPKRFRDVLTDNLAHLLTIDLPLVAEADGVQLNRARPCFWGEFKTCVLGSIPQAVEIYPPRTTRVLETFRGIRYLFTTDVPVVPPRRTWKTKPRAVVLFSSGKDSLVSLGLAREMGLDPVAVYVDDTVSPSENRIKRSHLGKLARMGFPVELVTNEVERLNDFKHWKRDETCLGYMHMVTAFAFLALPIAYAFQARYVILGNQQDMNFPFVNKDGFYTYPSFDQTSSWTMQVDAMVRAFTGGGVRVMSLIEPLTNVGVMKLLLERYPELVELLVSCDSLDACVEPRWCQECSKCATLALLMRALGGDPRAVGIRSEMMGLADAPLYAVLGGVRTDNYERSAEAREEQALCFLLAIEHGLSGPLIDRFKARFAGKFSKQELLAKFLKLYPPATVPVELRTDLMTILRDAMS